MTRGREKQLCFNLARSKGGAGATITGTHDDVVVSMAQTTQRTTDSTQQPKTTSFWRGLSSASGTDKTSATK